MKNLTVEKLLEFNFEKIDVSIEESGDKPFSYFTLDIGEYGPCLITDSSDEIENGLYSVTLFNYDGYGYCYNDVQLKKLITLLSNKK